MGANVLKGMEGVNFLMIQQNPNFSNPHFFEPPNNSSQKLFPSSQSNTVILSLTYFSYLILLTNFHFPWRFQKLGFHRLYNHLWQMLYSFSSFNHYPSNFITYKHRRSKLKNRPTVAREIGRWRKWYMSKKRHITFFWLLPYLPTLLVFPGVSKFFIKSPGLSECLLGDFRGLFLDIIILSLMTFSQCKDF